MFQTNPVAILALYRIRDVFESCGRALPRWYIR